MSKEIARTKTTTTEGVDPSLTPSLEGRLVAAKSKLRLIEICLEAHFNLGENIDDVMSEMDDLVKACHRELESIHREAPAAVLNWSKAEPR